MSHFPQLDAFRGGNGIIRLIGHRGARGHLAENTLIGFEFTMDVGVRALEFDVVLTGDDVPVVTHNHRLSNDATRSASGVWLSGQEAKVATYTLAELQRLDVGGLDGRTPYGQRFADQAFLSGHAIPALAELCALVAQAPYADVHLMLELKSDPDLKDDPRERSRLVRLVVEQVRNHGVTGRTILHSFDWQLLDECRRQAPEMPTSYLSVLPEGDGEADEKTAGSVGPDHGALHASLPQAVAAAGGQLWCPRYTDVSAELVAQAHALDLLVCTWTVNESADIDAMIGAGVDGIVTDYPGRVQRRLLDHGLHWLG